MPRSSGLKTTDESAGMDFLVSDDDDDDDKDADLAAMTPFFADVVGRDVVSSPNSYSSSTTSLAAPIFCSFGW